jgi:hypothetical protein
MEPTTVVHRICGEYIKDLGTLGVDPALLDIVRGYVRSRNIAGLSSCTRHYKPALHTVKEWTGLRQIEAFYKKNALFAKPEICFCSALESFLDSETACSETNLRLKHLVGYPSRIDERYQTQIKRMGLYIRRVLGDFHSFTDALPGLVKVTPGATSTSSRENSLPQLKMRLKLFATQRAAKYLKACYHMYGFKNLRVKAVHSNRVELVPKNWKTHRTIACEPEGNIPLQLAFDTWAKRRLRQFGIDLRDQTVNQNLAKHGSIHNDLVTVDFKSASDTISFNTVQLVFPVDWFKFLCDVRTPGFSGVFGIGTYSKFSSMGNGSTFCIETLLFAAACYAVGSEKFSVYGDDVIIEREFFEAYVELTRFLGFTVNEEKSFSDGPFRESCGGDFYNGINVTPAYIRNLDARKATWVHLINSLIPVTLVDGQLRKYLCSLVKSERLPFAPFNESTISGIWIDPEIARKRGILTKCLYKKADTYILRYKAYNASCKELSFVDSRGYYLWFLRKNAQAFFAGPWDISNGHNISAHSQTSSAPTYDHKYRRIWVVWQEPDPGKLDRILLWSEQLFRQS